MGSEISSRITISSAQEDATVSWTTQVCLESIFLLSTYKQQYRKTFPGMEPCFDVTGRGLSFFVHATPRVLSEGAMLLRGIRV